MASRGYATLKTDILSGFAQDNWDDAVTLCDLEVELVCRDGIVARLAADRIGARLAELQTLTPPTRQAGSDSAQICIHGNRTRAVCRICTPGPFDQAYWFN